MVVYLMDWLTRLYDDIDDRVSEWRNDIDDRVSDWRTNRKRGPKVVIPDKKPESKPESQRDWRANRQKGPIVAIPESRPESKQESQRDWRANRQKGPNVVIPESRPENRSERAATKMETYGGDKDRILPTNQNPLPAYNHVTKCLKYSITVFAFFLWIVGGLFAAIGGYINTQIFDYENLSKLAFVPGSIICIAGVVIFIMSTFGVLGAYRENITLLKTYRIFLITILFVEVFIGFLGFAFWPEVKKIVDIKISAGIRRYTEDPSLRAMMDLLQRELHCCGHLTIDDWDSNPYYSCRNIESYRHCGVPWSCCHHRFYRNRHCGLGTRQHDHNRRKVNERIFTEGCLDRSFEFFKWNMKICGGLAVASAVPILIAILQTRRLMRNIKRNIDEEIEKLGEMGTVYT